MQPGNEHLVVRQHDRFQCRLVAEIRVAELHASRVALARNASAAGAGGFVRAWAVDCSSGGIGLDSTVFFPKSCRLLVRLLDAGTEAVVFEGEVRIQRVTMLDRTPRYYIGTAFVETDAAGRADLSARLDRLLQHVRSSAAGAGVGAGA